MLRFLLKRKIIISLFTLFVFVSGIYGVVKLDKELFPAITFDQSLIFIETNDMPAEDVEQFVTIPVEQVLDGMQQVEHYESTSSTEDSVFIIEIASGMGSEVTKDIESQIQGLKSELHGVNDILIMEASTEAQYEFFLDISGGSSNEMTEYATNILKPKLEALKEVREVHVTGLEEKEVSVTLKSDKLTEYNISQEEIVTIIQQMNMNLSLGNLPKDGSIRWNTTFEHINDIKNIPIATETEMITLADVAKVEKIVNTDSQFAWKNGNQDFILLQIGRTDGYTQIDMTEAVRQEIVTIEKETPETIIINEIAAQADYVNNAIDGVIANILIGGVIAMIVLLLFLRNIRATMIIGLSIPTSILLTIFTMFLLDYSFNLLSLMGLGLGIGMMVDASIVVLESIFKKREEGLSNFKSVIAGTKEVASAVISSALTTIVVFVPIVLLDDEIGKFMIVLTVVIAVSLISSVLVSFTLIPALTENFMKVIPKSETKHQRIAGRYGKTLNWIAQKKRRKISVIGTFFIIFISSFALLTKVPMTIMPDILDRYAEVMVELEPGVTPEEREETAIALNKQLAKIPDVANNIIMPNMDSLFALINMTPEADKTMEQSEINEEILHNFREIADDYPIMSVASAMEGVSNLPIEIKITGDDLTKLEDIGQDVIKELSEIESVVSPNLLLNYNSEELVIQLNEKTMKDDGITAGLLYQQVAQLFFEMPIGEFINNGKNTPIIMKNDFSIQEQQQLLNQNIVTLAGEEKLSKYVTLEKTETVAEINREDGNRYLKVVADIESADLGTVNRDVHKLIKDFDTESGYSVSIGGDLQEQQEAAQDLLLIFALSLFLVFVVMAIQFNSFKHPLIILIVIPFTVTGVIIGLFLTQAELNVMSGIGVIMLVGIVLNNAILLIDRVNQLRNQGSSINEAVIEAGRNRLRPILMTTLTTVGGMIPLAFATGASSGYQSPLAIVIISGLLFSTLITLILIPSMYLIFEDINTGIKKMFTRKSSKRHKRKNKMNVEKTEEQKAL